MRVRRALAALGTSVTLVLGGQIPAHAATDVSAAATCAGGNWEHTMYTNDDNPGGRIDFQPYCDVVRVCDVQEDGYSVWIQVFDYDQGIFKYTYQLSRGSGSCQYFDASMGAPYDLAEGNVFRFTVALKNSGSSYLYFMDDAYWLNSN